MTHQQARRRFTTVLIVSMGLFLLASIGLGFAHKNLDLPLFLPWLLVIVPIVALLTPLCAQWRYLNDIDEYLRSLEIRAIFIGLVAVLMAASAWGYAELFIDGPSVPMYWLNQLYWVAYAVASVVLNAREGQQA